QGDDAWDTLHGYLAHVAPELAERMHRHVGNQDVFNAYRIDEQLLKALDRKVWLPSGGTLVIDRTEAMTVIDVNTGKFTGSGGNLEETVTRNNLEAAEEIVRQLRLRDVGGIIVIDFIDMVLEANRDLVLRRLTECLARDRTRHQVAEVTSLGLVQMTRKRVGGGLLEHFSAPCEHCRGRGVIVDTEAIEYAEVGKSDTAGSSRKSRGGRGRRGDGESNGHNGNGRSAHGSGNGADAGPGGDHSAVVAATAVIAAAGSRTAAPTVAETAPADHTAGAVTDEVPVLDVAAVDVAAVDVAAVETEVEVGVEQVVDVPVVPAADVPTGDAAVAPDAPDAAAAPAPRRRRARVTRTGGAPTVTEGEAPAAAVVTVSAGPTPPAATDDVAPPAVAAQPEPTAATRPRRGRRAASRPAGPPVEANAEAGTDANGGDPV
ncbi:MAG: ribonuclease E/G, partial [Pseudonocardia sp.]|nr:ribonuclease E/G [Pseudonocardia sp.]